MKKIAKKEYSRPVNIVINMPCKTLLTTSTEIDPYAEEETIDIPLDDIQVDPNDGTFDAL